MCSITISRAKKLDARFPKASSAKIVAFIQWLVGIDNELDSTAGKQDMKRLRPQALCVDRTTKASKLKQDSRCHVEPLANGCSIILVHIAYETTTTPLLQERTHLYCFVLL